MLGEGHNPDNHVRPKDNKNHYLLALMVSLTSTATPILFMLSCMFVVKFHQGDYEKSKWKHYNPFQKFFNYILLSIFGYLLMALIFVTEIVMRLCLLLSLIGGKAGYKVTQTFFRGLIM